MTKNLIVLLVFIMPYLCNGQSTFTGEAVANGYYSTGEELPFWMHANQRGRFSPETNVAGWVTGKWRYDFYYDASIEIGAGLLMDDAAENIFIDELYAKFSTSRFYITAGRKQQEEVYAGLSASGKNILWSLNANPLPGIQFGTNGIQFFEGESGFGVAGSWNEYLMEQDRFVSYTRLHHKNFFLIYKTKNNFQVKAGLQHFAQWAGNYKTGKTLPGGGRDYVKIIAAGGGASSATTGKEYDALGNHLGSYELNLKKIYRDLEVEFIYNHLFDDVSGMQFQNIPDGRYGFFLNFTDRDRLIDKILYEFYYTRNQSVSGPEEFEYSDNYFNHEVYRNGWTYRGRVLGVPFAIYDSQQGKFTNNKFYAHHFGISGSFSNYFVSYPYKLLLSFGRNDGSYEQFFGPNEDVLYWSYEMLLLKKFLDLKVQLAGEYNSVSSPIHAIGLQVSKRF